MHNGFVRNNRIITVKISARPLLEGRAVHTSAKYLLLLVGVAAAALGPFEELYAWKQIDFQFPNASAREAAIASGDFLQINNLPVGIGVWKDKLFVTVPRWKTGVPSNLNYVSLSNTAVHASAKYLLLLVGVAAAALGPFEELYAWKQIDFQFPNASAREAAIASGDFVQINNLPVGIGVWKDKLFVTVPRWKTGVPSNLNYVSLSNTAGNKSPALMPYPSWEANDIHQSGSEPIVNVFRVAIDACDRLWAIDAGSDDILGEGTLVTAIQIIVIDLKTDQIIRRYKLTDSDQKVESFFANLVVDVDADACDKAYAYVSDLGANGLVVYSWEQEKSWRVTHNYFAFDPLHGDFNVSGINFHWTDGIFGMALSPLQSDGYKKLYFHALASTTEFVVSTSVLQNEALATSSGNYYHFKRLGFKGDLTQSTASVMDWQTGVAFFGAVNRNGISCWDTNKPMDQTNFLVVAEDKDALVFPNDVKIARDERQLYVITDKMPIFQYADIDPEQVNYRILRASVDEAAKTCL